MVFKIILLLQLCTLSYAREIIVLSAHPSQQAKLQYAQRYITQQLGIAPKLITHTELTIKPERYPHALIQLYINKNGKMNFPIYKKEGYSLGTWTNQEYWSHLLDDDIKKQTFNFALNFCTFAQEGLISDSVVELLEDSLDCEVEKTF